MTLRNLALVGALAFAALAGVTRSGEEVVAAHIALPAHDTDRVARLCALANADKAQPLRARKNLARMLDAMARTRARTVERSPSAGRTGDIAKDGPRFGHRPKGR